MHTPFLTHAAEAPRAARAGPGQVKTGVLRRWGGGVALLPRLYTTPGAV